MTIRRARPEDARAITPLLLLAMEDIFFDFIGTKTPHVAHSFLTHLVEQKQNQYSYENCWVVEDNGELSGVACVYDGEHLEDLRAPIAQAIKAKFNRNFNPEDETQAGEVYIDCIGVNPKYQGQGIGSRLFQFLIHEYVKKQHAVLGLIVDLENPKAKKLYKRLGFKVVGTKQLTGKHFEHMQLTPD